LRLHTPLRLATKPQRAEFCRGRHTGRPLRVQPRAAARDAAGAPSTRHGGRTLPLHQCTQLRCTATAYLRGRAITVVE